MNPFAELESLLQKDSQLRTELVREGKLFSGYNPAMEALQIENGRKLEKIIEQYGWPDDTVGKELVHAAWIIAMHAISLPSLQRKILAMFKQNPKLYPSPQSAMLEDRILIFSGKKQIFGTQMDWDENGLLSPFPIESPETVNERRKAAGLGSLSEAIDSLRKRSVIENEQPPLDIVKYAQMREEWMLRVGWISNRKEN